MLTTKKIKSLPLPKINNDTKVLASQDMHPLVMTVQKVGSKYVCINIFGTTGEDAQVKLRFRYFLTSPVTKEGYLYNLDKNKVTNGYLSNVIDKTVTATEKEAEKFASYFGITCKYINSGLYDIETIRRTCSKVAQKEKKEKEYKAVMKGIRPYPKSFEKTIEKTMAFSKYIFFDKQTGVCTCSACGEKMDVKDLPPFKEKDEGKCPVCGASVTYFSEKKRPHMKPDNGTALLIKAAGHHKLLVRHFNISYSYRNGTRFERKVFETYRTFVDYDKHTTKDYINYYFNRKQQWCEPKRSLGSDGYHYEIYNGELHRKGLTAEIRKAGLLERFDKAEEFLETVPKKRTCYQHLTYFVFLAKYPFCEQLVKSGLYRLAKHFYNESYTHYNQRNVIDKTATSTKKMVKAKDIVQMREMIAENVSYEDLWCIQLHNEVATENRSVKEILRIANLCKEREKEAFSLSKGKLNKLLAYFEKQEEKAHLAIDYFDYIENCKKLGYDMTSEIVLYPKNFKEAHDKAVADVKYESLKATYEKIALLLPAMHERYDLTDEKAGLMIKAPDKGADITYEGQALKHCVGGYVERVSRGETTILFIRKLAQPDKPFVTMEVANDRIIQVRGFGNGDPGAEVKQFVEKFKKEKHVA